MILDFNDAPRQRGERYTMPTIPIDPIASFLQKMAEYDLHPGNVVTNGKIQRFDIDHKNDKAGWYVFFNGEKLCGGSFGSWKDTSKVDWCSRDTARMTDAEAVEHREIVRNANLQRETEQQAIWEQAKTEVQNLWDSCPPADPDHPYLIKKGVKSYGLRRYQDKLLVPGYDENGTLWMLQRIYPKKLDYADTDKLTYPGCKAKGMSYVLPGGPEIYLVEGYATGVTVHEATGGTVVIAFTAGNMVPVAEQIRAKYPLSKVTICADNDQFNERGNTGVQKGREAANRIGARLLIPEFKDPKKGHTDFNDLWAVEGTEAVKAQLSATPPAGAKTLPFPPLSESITQAKGRIKHRPEPTEFILRYNDQGLIPKGIVGVLTATGGTGKTFFLLSILNALASGGEFGPINSIRPTKCLGIFGEDPQEELDRRLWDICKGKFAKLLHAVSVYGQVGPLMRMDGNTPVRADGFYWLEETIKQHPGLEFLCIDPKSRFYGLDENSSDHATQWISTLEYLVQKYSITILFTHHTSKGRAGTINQDMSRGSSAIVDGCRWQGGLVRLDAKEAERYGIENARDYIKFDAPKMNYGPDMPRAVVFKRGHGGVLEYAEIDEKTNIHVMAEYLVELISAEPEDPARRDLTHGGGVWSDMIIEMKERFPFFVRSKQMDLLYDYIIQNGMGYEDKIMTDTKPKIALKVGNRYE